MGPYRLVWSPRASRKYPALFAFRGKNRDKTGDVALWARFGRGPIALFQSASSPRVCTRSERYIVSRSRTGRSDPTPSTGRVEHLEQYPHHVAQFVRRGVCERRRDPPHVTPRQAVPVNRERNGQKYIRVETEAKNEKRFRSVLRSRRSVTRKPA